MFEMCDGKLKLYSEVTETAVDWLWYPFIPYGKVTLLQGDPGCGKSTLMMSLIAAVSSGNSSPDGMKIKKPIHVIYQCSEDGVSDTIKPRLLNAGADCNNVAFLDEETDWLTLDDEKIRRAIADFNAKLLVIDPVQAYLGETDIASAVAMRKMLRQLASWATMYDCAVVLIGHLNKKQSSKELYRSLGSIDLIATARSVLHIERMPEDEEIVVIHHIKSSLTSRNKDVYFTLDEHGRVEWLEQPFGPRSDKSTKQLIASNLLKACLANGPTKATDILERLKSEGISERTIHQVKKQLEIRSIKRDSAWYWLLPEFEKSSGR